LLAALVLCDVLLVVLPLLWNIAHPAGPLIFGGVFLVIATVGGVVGRRAGTV
jgi:hypothetical protein